MCFPAIVLHRMNGKQIDLDCLWMVTVSWTDGEANQFIWRVLVRIEAAPTKRAVFIDLFCDRDMIANAEVFGVNTPRDL